MKSTMFMVIHYEELIKTVYTATDLKLYKGYRLSAIDGSTVELQNTEELRNVFGYAENGKVEIARARISGLYDVENNIMIDAIIDNYKSSERDLALRHEKSKTSSFYTAGSAFINSTPFLPARSNVLVRNIKTKKLLPSLFRHR
ncbi:MAG: hypothetical protein ACYCVD_08795 [Desulfitobacteriaceae bacterium]